MKPEDKIKELVNKSDAKTSAEVDNRILAGASEHLEKLREKNLAAGGGGIRRIIIKSPIAKLAAAAVIVIAAFIGIHQITAPGIAWADVAERFRSVPFFSVAIYTKEDAISEPQQMELWMSGAGKTRMRLGTQVVFGSHSEIVESFDIKTRARVEPDERAVVFLRRIGEADEFSLDSIIRVMFGGTMQDVTPLVNPDAVISQDIVVFDVEIPGTPEWVRIWALRESRLPVRIRVWDPRDGDSTDAIFEYSREQADEFFDPNAFKQFMSSGQTTSRVNFAYAFLKDPGGKQITPEDMFEQSGYHLPIVTHAGITPEGAVWIIADKGLNQMPNGRNFYGFTRIRDDLGREYETVRNAHRTATDQSREVFVPKDYPFDRRVPGKITLICEADDYRPDTNDELIGTVDLTEWKQNTPCPDIFGPDYADTLSLKISLAHKLIRDENADRRNRLLQTIPMWTENPGNMRLLNFWTSTFYLKKDYAEVIRIGRTTRLLMLERPHEIDRYSFRNYLIALGITGQIDEAAQIFKRIDAIDEMSPKKSNEEIYNQFVYFTAQSLASTAELTPDQISKILGFDISQRKEYESILQRANQTATNRKHRLAAEKRLKEISNYYLTHPLPDRMQLLERSGNEAIHLAGVSNTLPDHEGYMVLPINYPISAMVSSLNFFDDIHPYDLFPVRIEDDAAERELFADLVCKDGITPQERAEFVLNLYGMELIVEDGESRQVLVAKYNGRKLKAPQQVKAPLQYDGNKKSKLGMTSATAMAGFEMRSLLNGLVFEQNRDIKDSSKKLVIFNETGIEGSVSSERAFWPGDEGLKLAKDWFKEHFGVTFIEETRTMKTYVIRTRNKG